MERITYRITLDAHRNGIQRTLQGFETADIMARRISINLVASGDTFELPMTNVVAMMYVTTPSASEPSINECVIDGNTIIYDVEPITEEGITEMQLKVIGTSTSGATSVLIAPRFAVEFTESGTDDEKAEQSTKFTALENAIAKADAIYNSRITSIEVTNDCRFIVYYADGTTYESDYFHEALYNGNALLSQSYAIGDSGIRSGEDTDNSKYYSNVSRSVSEASKKVFEESSELLNESKLHSIYTYFQPNFESGELGYISSYCDFEINKETGELIISKDQTYTPEDVILSNAEGVVQKVIDEYSTQLSKNTNAIEENKELIQNNAKSIRNNTQAIETNASNIGQLSNPNLLINGDFQIWQRGTEFEFNNLTKVCYSADRWGIYNMQAQTIKVKKLEKGLQFEVSDNFNYLFQMLETPLEIGEDYMLSAKVNGEVRTLGIVGGIPVENEYFRYYQYNNTYDSVQIKPNGVTTIEWVKLEKGTIATPFVPRLYAEELMLCQRYYQCGIYALHRYYNFGNNHFIYVGELKTHMRTLPTAGCDFANIIDGEGMGRPAQIYGIMYGDDDINNLYTNDGFWFEARTHFLGYEPQQDSAVMEAAIRFDAEIY